MKYLYSIFVLLCLFFSPNLSGQSIDKNTGQNSQDKSKNAKGLELYLKNTVLSIASDQKNLLALNIKEENKELSDAIVLQKHAITLFQSGKEKEALICSSKARQLGVTLLKKLKGDEYASHYDHFENEEQQIAEIGKDTSTVEDWLREAKK